MAKKPTPVREMRERMEELIANPLPADTRVFNIVAKPRDPQTIELDCAPGGLRPGDLIANVIKGTGLPKREPVAKFFGNWTWDYTDVPEKKWLKAKPILKERIEALYNNGSIRYGSW